MSKLETKRFVIRKSLIGKNTIITFVNKKQEKVSYNHDEVYNTHKERFEAMNCFAKYKSYTNSNAIPAFCRDLQLSQQQSKLSVITTREVPSSVQWAKSQFHVVQRLIKNANKYRQLWYISEFDSHATTKIYNYESNK